jgi:hypothetical protein
MENSQDNVARKCHYLSAEDKYQIFLEATMAKANGDVNVSEVLRLWGIHANDLTRIRKTVE